MEPTSMEVLAFYMQAYEQEFNNRLARAYVGNIHNIKLIGIQSKAAALHKMNLWIEQKRKESQEKTDDTN